MVSVGGQRVVMQEGDRGIVFVLISFAFPFVRLVPFH